MSELFKIVKLKDVARKAGVGNATASRALSGVGKVSDEARRRILDAAAALNYRPNRTAQALKGGRSGMIGMMVPRLSDLFFATCVDAVELVSRKNSSLLVVAATHDRSDHTVEAIKQLLRHNVDGLVLATSEYLTGGMVRNLQTLPIPTVGIDAPLTKAGLRSVVIDNFSGAKEATEHLISHGHSRIESVQVNPRLFTMRERRRGYEQAMQDAGLEPKQHVIDSRAQAEDVLRASIKKHGRAAFLGGNETAAKFMVAAAKHLGLDMPGNFAMVSFDDFELADSMETPLTVVRQPAEQIGDTAARLLFQHMKAGSAHGEVNDLETTLKAELILRRSCGCNGAT